MVGRAAVLVLALGAAVSVPGAPTRAQATLESLGGDLRSLPECLRVGPTTHCWGLSAGSTMGWWRDGAYVNLGGPIRAAPECVARGGRMDCFAAAPAATGGLATIAYDGAGWGSWSRIGAAQLRQKPACVLQGGEIGCVALADVAHPVNGWWAFAPGTGEEPRPVPFPAGVGTNLRPMCEVAARGTHCFAVSTAAATAGQLWTILRSKQGEWGAWQPIHTDVPLGETPHCLASGVKLDCFARTAGADRRLIAGSFDGRSWGRWAPVGEGTVMSQPYCAKLGSGFDCFYTSPAGDLRRRQLVRGVWQGEATLGGPARARPECLADPGGHDTACYVQGGTGDNTLRRLRVG
jgi:hypothetical protein